MRKILFKRGKVAAAFITMLFVTTLVASFTPKATATPTLTISIDPTSGPVAKEVKVNGTIDTLDGPYTVRWDETLNATTGYATGNNVTTSFAIPQTVGAPPGRDVLVELIDDNKTVDNIVNTTFRLYTEYHIKAVAPSPPSQLQEGQTTDIWVNVTGGEANTRYWANITVTDPSGAVYYNDTLRLTNTTNTGVGEGSITYPADFSLGANTNYVGTYNMAFNGTLATGNFTVGLTDKLEYRRAQTVYVQGAGYNAYENVTVDITLAASSVAGYPKNVTADTDGVVTDSWLILEDAKPGTYTVTLTNATTPGTDKKPADAQNFTVLGAVCLIQAWNVAVPPEPLANVTVWARNVTTNAVLDVRDTNETGWVEFPVELGNYTFEALWKVDGNNVTIGHLRNQSFTEIKTYKLNLTGWVANLKIAIHDEAGDPLPFIDVSLNYSYITQDNQTVSRTDTSVTNTTGIRTFPNMFANISYTIEARRYGNLFNRTEIENLTATRWINITCPTYTMFVHVLDSKGLPLQNVEVAVYEWSSGVAQPVQSETTNDWGNATFHITFGKYKIWIYNQNRTVILNKTVADLIEDRLSLTIRCKISNVDLSVVVKDYFGNPIPNALVRVEREGVDRLGQKTGSNGIAPFYNITGGDLQISVSVRGKLCETRTLYLDGTRVVVFKLEKYIVVGGYPLEATQLITFISLGILVTSLALALIYRRLRPRKVSEEKEKSL